MIRKIVERCFDNALSDPKYYVEAAGLSTDAKPTAGLVTGSLFMEADTGKVYVFDETGAGTWTEIGG